MCAARDPLPLSPARTIASQQRLIVPDRHMRRENRRISACQTQGQFTAAFVSVLRRTDDAHYGGGLLARQGVVRSCNGHRLRRWRHGHAPALDRAWIDLENPADEPL